MIPCFSVQPSPEKYLRALEECVHPEAKLQRKGFILRQLHPAEIERKKRCINCLLVMSKQRPCHDPIWVPAPASEAAEGGQNTATEPAGTWVSNIVCRYHSDRVVNKRWTCCNVQPHMPGCKISTQHEFPPHLGAALESSWQFYPTPPADKDANQDWRTAVVIDCEMGTAATGDSELIRVSAVDQITSEVLVDSLVYPNAPMAHFNTRLTGITRRSIEDARRKGKCIMDKTNARKALWKFVGPETIVVGHAVHNDLVALRWIHPRLIDTQIVEAELHPNTPLGLKHLALLRLQRNIQLPRQPHSSLEDAMATRDLLDWNIRKRCEDIF